MYDPSLTRGKPDCLRDEFLVVAKRYTNPRLLIILYRVASHDERQYPGFRFRRLLREFQYKMLSRTSLARLLNKIDSSSASKDGNIAAVHGLPQQQRTLLYCCLYICGYIILGVLCRPVVLQLVDASTLLSFAACRRQHVSDSAK